jgi:hypothetical protein
MTLTDFDVPVSKDMTLRVVRAFHTSNEVRNEYGIYANFSAKVIHHAKNGDEHPVFALNALSVRTSRENVPFIASMGTKTNNGMIWAIQFFPGAADDEKQAKRQQEFVDKVILAVNEFAVRAKHSYQERKSNQKVPEQLKLFVQDDDLQL